MNSLYLQRSIGVLGTPKDERSSRDTQMQQEYGRCGAKEGYMADQSVGVTEIPVEYKNGFEERSVRDKQVLAEFNRCGGRKESYCGGGASIYDNPFNPLIANAQQIPASKFN
jgi:hypothetical protein